MPTLVTTPRAATRHFTHIAFTPTATTRPTTPRLPYHPLHLVVVTYRYFAFYLFIDAFYTVGLVCSTFGSTRRYTVAYAHTHAHTLHLPTLRRRSPHTLDTFDTLYLHAYI